MISFGESCISWTRLEFRGRLLVISYLEKLASHHETCEPRLDCIFVLNVLA